MYKRARIKLTIIYSLIFFVLFWIMSLGLCMWFSQSLGTGYITEVKQRHLRTSFPEEFGSQNTVVVQIAGSVAYEELRNIILILNGILIIVVPSLGWLLTGSTLRPIEIAGDLQRQFVSDASHEMRTPLSIMRGEMDVALAKSRTAMEYKKTIVSSKEEVERLSRLIENLIFLARGDQGRQYIKFQDIDITDLISSIVSKFNLKISEKKLKVTFVPPDEEIIVKGQTSMMWTLFSNIIDNAVKYSFNKGIVRIAIIRSDHYAVISVKDSGIGISREDQEKIFNRFYRGDPSRSTTKGYGLGLAIVRSIVALHKGKIAVHSTPGNGTTFTVYLPYTRNNSFS